MCVYLLLRQAGKGLGSGHESQVNEWRMQNWDVAQVI